MSYKNELVSDDGKKIIFESNYKINDDVLEVFQDIAFKKSIIDIDWQNIQNFIDEYDDLEVFTNNLSFSEDFFFIALPDEIKKCKEIILVIYASSDITLYIINGIREMIKRENNDIQIMNYIYTMEKAKKKANIKIIYGTRESKSWSSELQNKTYEEIANMITTTEGDELLWVLGSSWAPYARLKHISGKLGKMSVENAHKNYHAPPNERKYIIEIEDIEKGTTNTTEEFASVDALIDDGWVLD